MNTLRRRGHGTESVAEESASTGVPSAWERVKLARHPNRPKTLDYLDELMADFVELRGDRSFGDDQALIGGLARFGSRTVLVIGHQKGRDTRENISRNFGMAKPEGYRKAERLMRHAEKFGIPVITFIDTSGADPTIGSEERGQGTAIAESLLTMAALETPVVAVVIGEGGSGGALAIGVADRVLMLENSVYSVVSPEGCASILWKDAGKAPEAAETMRMTAPDLMAFGIIDELIEETTPAHEQPRAAIKAVGNAISRHLDELTAIASVPGGIQVLLDNRYQKFRQIGAWREETAP
ncbi:MAG: acetyl-CoA carboxylase carboxyltransferase subunit alpha [Thermomicrobiales bacterium]|nr:acetyl-CoA carboxylase carboxyltransferase subunit alpha [Thermomicrobiales bacterium]